MQKRLFLLTIALIILIPATGVLTGLGAMSDQGMRSFEGRTKTPFREDVSKWFTDNLGLRELFLTAYSSVLLFVFGQSSNPDMVQVGQKGFLFLGDRNMKTFSTHSGLGASKEKLLHLGEGFKDIITLFQKKEIPVLSVIAPDKATIYGEYYPKWVKHVSRSFPRDNFNMSPLLQKHVLFLEDDLLKYKKHSNLLYRKNDTHWNDNAAYLGYTAVMDRLEKLLEKKLERVPLLGWKTVPPWRGDLERMNRVAPDKDILYNLLLAGTEPRHISLEEKGKYSKSSNKKALNSLNIAVVHDSFYPPEFYRKTFNTVYELHYDNLRKANLAALLAESPPPDLLIFLMVERSTLGRDLELKRLARELSPSGGS